MADGPLRALYLWLRPLLPSLVPLVLVAPLRLLVFPFGGPVDLVVTGPLTEEPVKLFLSLAILRAVLLIRNPVSHLRLARRAILITPVAMGLFFGIVESVLQYPGEATVRLLVRLPSHATFASFSLATFLWFRQQKARFWRASWVGIGVAVAVHATMNTNVPAGFIAPGLLSQAAYVFVLFAAALIALIRVVRREPSQATIRLSALTE